MNILAVPIWLWHLYVEYLWDYKPGSWVDSTASTCRVLAFIVIAPFVLLTLLDVTSYLIARTLGVIDVTKASTSETEEGPIEAESEVVPSTPPSQTSTDVATADEPNSAFLAVPTTTPPPTYFRNSVEEDGNLQLSGVDMFSPAPSQPPSPTMSRRELNEHMHNVSEGLVEENRGADTLHRIVSRESSSGESSFAMVEQESGVEDSHLTLRKRTRAGTGSSRSPGS